MRRATLAAWVGFALWSVAGCGAVNGVGTDVDDPSGSLGAGAQPATGSACLTTPTTGDSTVMVEWVDFVQLHGIRYVADPVGKGPEVGSDRVGRVVGRVTCELSSLEFHSPPGPSVDGDAAFLHVGTPVHALRGYPTACRVVARVAGESLVYVAHQHRCRGG